MLSHWWNPTCCFKKYSNFPSWIEWKLLSKVSSPLRKRSTDLFRLCAESDNLEISMICVFWNNLSFDSEDLMRTTGPSVKNKLRLVWWLLKILWKVGLWYFDHLKGCADLSHRVFMTSNKRMKEYECIPIGRRERADQVVVLRNNDWPMLPLSVTKKGPVLALTGWETCAAQSFPNLSFCAPPLSTGHVPIRV